MSTYQEGIMSKCVTSCVKTLSYLAVLTVCSAAYAADSFFNTNLYQEKSGIKTADYSFAVPTNKYKAPIVEVYQSNGVFSNIIRDKDIFFTTAYRVECGKGWKLSEPALPKIIDSNNQNIASHTSSPNLDGNLYYVESVMSNYVPPAQNSPQEMCNRVINDRRSAGFSVSKLLKKGFWTKIDQAYKSKISYVCVNQKKQLGGFKEFFRYPKLEGWQPLYVHCLGDKNYGKVYAKTSKKTSTKSASQTDIKEQLDKKRQSNTAAPKLKKKVIKYRALLDKGNHQRTVSQPKTLDEFFAYGEKMAVKRKYRLLDFEIVRHKGERLYVGLWAKGSGTSILNRPLSISEFNQYKLQQNAKGLVLIDFELFGKGDKRRAVGLWNSGDVEDGFSPSMSVKNFIERNATLEKIGFFPVDIEARVEKGEFRIAALWHKGQSYQATSASQEEVTPTYFLPPREVSNFRLIRDELNGKGEKVIDIERVVRDGKVYYMGLVIKEQSANRLSKPRDYESFKRFMKSENNFYINDLEIHHEE